ncbi:hypothetical protein [Ruegeria atlantica]|uniref:hypothetical protein n=1 Tax=Ruegeria atlantica TaxID=81569 RepID=UPI002494E710|nr:hypothetical protein [Ruegeria atlantica]
MIWRAVIPGLLLASTALAEDEPFHLGVQTHMEQGWANSAIRLARDMGATHLRDEIGWAKAEKQPGVYNFDVADKYMLPIIKQGMTPLIVITDTNPLYDNGDTPHSNEGRKAMAAWVSAIFSHYGVNNVQIEIGNEVNADDFVSGPFTEDPPAYFASLVRAVRDRLDQDHPEAHIMCAGLNTIGIGFYRAFFQSGGLDSCDAISVHPYRDNPDTLLIELSRLTSLMEDFGGARPIYVTEFGQWFDDPHDAPDYMVKMVSQLATAGVTDAYWYALLDEEWWPNMGLLDKNAQNRKPAADAFELLQGTLLPLGRPTARDSVDTVHIYEFGDGGNGFVVWGSEADIEVTGKASYFDTRGRPIEAISVLSDTPVVITGQGLEVRLTSPGNSADTQYQFNQPPWSYFARRPEVGIVPLEVIDWRWPSFLGAPDLSPLNIGYNGITTARFDEEPYSAIERFTAKTAGSHTINGWWQAETTTEPSRLFIRHNDTILTEVDITTNRFSLPEITLDLQTGDVVEFEVTPTGPGGDSFTTRRIKISGPTVQTTAAPLSD